jgi:FkbM family methyltransferase
LKHELSPHATLVEARHGRFYVLDTDLYVGRSLRTYGEWTEAEIALLSKVLQPGDCVLDVGANVGSHTVPFSRAVGLEGRVIAFEPQLEIFGLLEANVALNGLANVDLHHAACGASAGTLDLPLIDYGREANFGGVSVRDLEAAGRTAAAPVRQVPLVRLDDALSLERLRLAKIDVEGMEIEVLRGAERIIDRLRPLLYVENEAPEQSPALLRALLDLGYAMYWHVVPFFDPENYRGANEDVFSGMGCVNVLCVPRGLALEVRGLPPVADLSRHPRIPG